MSPPKGVNAHSEKPNTAPKMKKARLAPGPMLSLMPEGVSDTCFSTRSRAFTRKRGGLVQERSLGAAFTVPGQGKDHGRGPVAKRLTPHRGEPCVVMGSMSQRHRSLTGYSEKWDPCCGPLR